MPELSDLNARGWEHIQEYKPFEDYSPSPNIGGPAPSHDNVDVSNSAFSAFEEVVAVSTTTVNWSHQFRSKMLYVVGYDSIDPVTSRPNILDEAKADRLIDFMRKDLFEYVLDKYFNSSIEGEDRDKFQSFVERIIMVGKEQILQYLEVDSRVDHARIANVAKYVAGEVRRVINRSMAYYEITDENDENAGRELMVFSHMFSGTNLSAQQYTSIANIRGVANIVGALGQLESGVDAKVDEYIGRSTETDLEALQGFMRSRVEIPTFRDVEDGPLENRVAIPHEDDDRFVRSEPGGVLIPRDHSIIEP